MIVRHTGASATDTAGGFTAGSKLDFTEDTLEACVLLEVSNKFFFARAS